MVLTPIMARVFLYGTFAGNRGDVLMQLAAEQALLSYGHVIVDADKDADIILHCCGYFCGDPWGHHWSREIAKQCVQWKESGKKIIFLPQTFGPFGDERIRSSAIDIVDHADLVCTRDRLSYDYLTALTGERASVTQFPDYTIDITPLASAAFHPHEHSVAVIANLRMIDKTSDDGAYISFLNRCIAHLRMLDADPFLLIHEEKDAIFTQMITPDIPVILEPDARVTKWIIGHSRAVISSRYHGILNALYQDIPVLATSWCHKFPELMREWGIGEKLVDVGSTDDILREDIRLLLQENPPEHGMMHAYYREQNRRLWEKVHALVGAPATLVA